MCLACEEQEYFFRVWCVDFLARGEMPPGVTEADLEAMGLSKPAAGAPTQKPVTPLPATQQAAKSRSAPAAFACDSPDE
jgi:hypothetical protein